MPSAAAIAIGLRLDETDRLIAALREVIWRWNAPERKQSLFVIKCLRLAPDLETCEALMRGEKVPRSRLDREWAVAYGY